MKTFLKGLVALAIAVGFFTVIGNVIVNWFFSCSGSACTNLFFQFIAGLFASIVLGIFTVMVCYVGESVDLLLEVLKDKSSKWLEMKKGLEKYYEDDDPDAGLELREEVKEKLKKHLEKRREKR